VFSRSLLLTTNEEESQPAGWTLRSAYGKIHGSSRRGLAEIREVDTREGISEPEIMQELIHPSNSLFSRIPGDVGSAASYMAQAKIVCP
jgi:hypothetical protein